ncbi:nucleotidyltransferase domain-containing protein [Kitasatospora sp. NPDC006697]|uniref:nucleotidyltransferase domain-containing protein n=1 Tax=Kitasatospora sp. NPDC006697 TaxID=3364020 RepID=UPI0036BF27A1
MRHGAGLDQDGLMLREGSLDRVTPEYAPVVAAVRAGVRRSFGGGSLHSAYLYGSIPRGTAVPGRSDLDLLLALNRPPTPADRSAADALLAALEHEFPQLKGGGVLLFGVERLLSEAERYDLGWFLACLCTPLLGPDLADRLPRYRLDSTLARETNGDLAELLPGWRARAERATSEAELRTLTRGAARKVVRTGFTLVMPRWQGWTSDLAESAAVFGHYYPERAEQMRTVAEFAPAGSADPAAVRLLLAELGPWLAAEYTARHGVRSPRG